MMTQRLTVRLDDEPGEWIKREAKARDRSMAYIVNECVEKRMADVGSRPKEADSGGDTLDKKSLTATSCSPG